MPSIVQKFKTGPRTYPAVEAITGGQLVEARSTSGGGAGVAAVGSVKVLGVALDDANPTGTPSAPTIVGGRPSLSAVVVPTDVAVAYNEIVPVTYAANAAFGDLLVAAANGQVTPVAAVTTPTAGDVTSTRGIVGRCEERGGVTAGNVGLAYIGKC